MLKLLHSLPLVE